MSPSSNTFLLPTGGFNRCWFSPIHFWKLKACSRPVAMTGILSRSRARAGKLKPAALEGAPSGLFFGIAQLEHGTADSAACLSEQFLPVFRMSVEFLRRTGALEGFAHRIEAVAHRLGAGVVALERKVGVVAHATIRAGLIEIRR